MGVLSGRTLLRLSGPDALTFLDGVLTRGPTLGPSTASPPPQACLATTLLTPQGKVLHEVLVHRLDDALILETRAEFADDLRRRLTLYRLRAKAEISIDDTLVPVWSETAEPRPDWSVHAPDPRLAALGFRGLMDKAHAAELVDATPDYDALRITLSVPELGADYAPETVFSMDVNHDVLTLIDYKKGCFVGQEVASRMKRKSEPRKRVWCLTAPPEVQIETGMPVRTGDLDIGEVGSVVRTPEAVKAIVRLRIDRVPEGGGGVTVAGNPVTVFAPDYL